MRSPVQARGGHTALPNELVARALGELTPEQFRLLVGLFFEAEFKREGGTAGTWRVGFGQVLASYEGLSGRYGLTVDAVRRALKRFERLGVTTRRAEAATSPATLPATQAATSTTTRTATPPTIVDLGRWASFLGSEREPATSLKAAPATSPATPAATEPAPIQHENTRTPNTEKPPSQGREGEAEQAARDTARAIGTEHRLRALAEADLDAKYPATARLLGWLRERGAVLDYPAKGSGRAAAEQALEAQELDVVGERVLQAWRMEPHPSLGWYSLTPRGRGSRAQAPARRPAASGPPAWRAMLDHAATHVASERFREDLASATVEEAAGELLVTPSDSYHAERLANLFGDALAHLASVAAPGVVVRVLPPLPAAAGARP